MTAQNESTKINTYCVYDARVAVPVKVRYAATLEIDAVCDVSPFASQDLCGVPLRDARGEPPDGMMFDPVTWLDLFLCLPTQVLGIDGRYVLQEGLV